MKTLIFVAISAATILPFAAFAQSADVKYCTALGDTYSRVVGLNSATAGAVPEAMAKCKAGDASGIPVLEKALTEQKVTLPPRG
jgi:hypothetical protein